MRRRNDLHEGGFAPGECALHVALQQRGERLRGLPLRMLGSQHLDAVEREHELGIQWLLGPQRAVIVEGGDPLGFRHKIGRALLRHTLD